MLASSIATSGDRRDSHAATVLATYPGKHRALSDHTSRDHSCQHPSPGYSRTAQPGLFQAALAAVRSFLSGAAQRPAVGLT